MSSSRLPGKVMKPLAGKPVIWHIYTRAEQCKLVDKVIVATSKDKTDDPLVKYCEINGLNVYRGSLNNVLSRFIEILNSTDYSYYVRITGDCPLIYPPFIDAQIDALATFEADAIWSKRESSVLEGQGVHSIHSLLYIWNKSSNPEDQEHVGSIYLTEHPEEFKIVQISIPEIFTQYPFRLTIDEEKDYEFLTRIYNNLYTGNDTPDLPGVINWLLKNEDVVDINKDISHKSLNLRLKELRRKWNDCRPVGKAKFTL